MESSDQRNLRCSVCRRGGDWMLEEGMVAPVHLLDPGGEHERIWLEEVVAIGKDGGRPLFSWGFGPLKR
jgi:hypothetical protein